MVILPDQACEIRIIYGSYANYDELVYRQPVLAHIQAHGVPVFDFDSAVPGGSFGRLNRLRIIAITTTLTAGAALFSQWTGEYVADWLQK